MTTYIRIAEFIFSEVHQLIVEAKSWVLLVSPYLELPVEVRDALQAVATQKTEVALVYRLDLGNGDNRGRAQLKWIRDTLPSATLLGVQRLHTKCYVSDQQAIVSSMNLLDSSRVNRELALQSWSGVDPLYRGILGQVEELLFLGVPYDKISNRGRASFQKRAGGYRPYCVSCGNTFEPESSDAKYCVRCDPSGTSVVARGSNLVTFQRMLGKMADDNVRTLYKRTIEELNSEFADESPEWSQIPVDATLSRADLIDEIVRWTFVRHFCNRCGRPTLDAGAAGIGVPTFYCGPCTVERREYSKNFPRR